MELQGKRVAVTGATGFVGSHITTALLDAGAAAIGVVRTPSKGAWLVERGATMVAADLTDKASMVAAFAGLDAIVSNAAMGSGGGDMAAFERVNCEGIRNLFEAAVEAGVKRVVHISTTAVYRTRLYRKMGEDSRPYDIDKRRFNWSDVATDWRYARTKRIAEDLAWQIANEAGLQLTTLRPSPVYGSRDHKATALLVRSVQGKKVRLAPTVGVPWVHAGDVAQATVGALQNDVSIGKAYNTTGPPVSLYRFLKTMKRELGGGALLVPVPVPAWVVYDTSAAAADLGFVSRPIDEGLAEALAEYKS